jgi:signal transduction histidine kinase
MRNLDRTTCEGILKSVFFFAIIGPPPFKKVIAVQNNNLRIWRPHDILISFLIIVILLVYTYGLLVSAPYLGFYFNTSDGQVLEIYEPENPDAGLEVGDFIERVGAVPFEIYRQGRTSWFPQGLQKGAIMDMTVRRNGESIDIQRINPGFNQPEFRARFFNVWWLAYMFWFAGMCAQLFVRPKDTRWRMFVASTYLTALFIMFGSVSSYHLLGSNNLLRMVAWLILPVYLHFHWIFPYSLRPVPRWLPVTLYGICGVLALGELFLPLPRPVYFLAVILAFGGSLLLFVLHYIFQSDHRPEMRFLAIAAFLALAPAILLAIAGSGGAIPYQGPVALLALPILPAAYFYILYQGNLGQLELRANRTMSLAFFFILLGTVLLLVVGYSGFVNIPPEALAFDTVMIALSTAFMSLLVFPSFQSFVERRILGIKLPGQSLSESYSARIVTSDALSDLLKLLRAEVFPSLLIRQYAFVQNLKASTQVLLSENVTQDQVRDTALKDLFASFPTEGLNPFPKPGQSLEWVRLMLPLRFGSELIGVWLLGRRDPDDRYPQAEIPILQSLANQTAVALTNIIQTERLKAMYGANINRYELERAGLARDLHDGFLNEMAGMLMKHDPASLPPEFLESFDRLIVRLREIVSQLRPPMLGYGLKFALAGLADNLSERTHDTVQILSEIQADGEWRYSEMIENNIYRIVQEACENALKYAHAKSIHITGELFADNINIQVSDDGVGFNAEVSLRSDELLANRHFGLAGMHERAELIGARLQIDSKPGKGTSVRVQWELN